MRSLSTRGMAWRTISCSSLFTILTRRHISIHTSRLNYPFRFEYSKRHLTMDKVENSAATAIASEGTVTDLSPSNVTAEEKCNTEEEVKEQQEAPVATVQSGSSCPPSPTTTQHSPISHDDFRFTSRRLGFTSELFKLEVLNVPQYVGFKQLRTRLKGLNLNPVKVKIHPSWCFVTFKSEEERQEAMKVITGHVWKKKTLRAIPAKPTVDPILKRKRQQQQEGSEAKKRCEDTRDLSERLSNAVTPLLNMPYEDQLSLKTNTIREFLATSAESINRLKPGAWFRAHLLSNDGLLCPLDPIKPSPVLTEYRNKCEFTIGLGPNNHTIVGFRLGAYRDGDLTVVPPTSVIVPEKTKKIVQVIQELVTESTLKPYDCRTIDGHWMQLTVRQFTTGETMVIVQFQQQQLSQDIVEKEQQSLVDKFKSVDVDILPTSLYWQSHYDRSSGKRPSPLQHLLGTEFVHEQLLGVTFRVSPDSFFQINSKATEVLYSTVGELVGQGHHDNLPIVYDLCCGTGSIGITLSKTIPVQKVIGVEMVEQAISDAKYNATANGLSNAEFVCGKVENILSLPKDGWSKTPVIAIADPPRGGMHPKVIQSIRRCSAIDTFIYVSCNPQGASNNIIDLCRPCSNRIKGLPFKPIKAIPVDMFPHTRHCELVVLFQRVKDNE